MVRNNPKHVLLNLAVSEALYRFVTGSNPNVEQNALFTNPDECKAVVAKKGSIKGWKERCLERFVSDTPFGLLLINYDAVDNAVAYDVGELRNSEKLYSYHLPSTSL